MTKNEKRDWILSQSPRTISHEGMSCRPYDFEIEKGVKISKNILKKYFFRDFSEIVFPMGQEEGALKGPDAKDQDRDRPEQDEKIPKKKSISKNIFLVFFSERF